MTGFIYNMQDELFHLNMILPVGEFSPIKKLVDHIEAQGKQLRELNAAITKRDATIEKCEHKNKDLRERNALLVKKVDELNEGIRNSEDLTWKQKYDALLQSSEQAIVALQKKCQEYKNSESDAIVSTIETLVKKNKELEERRDGLKKMCEDIMVEKNAIIKGLEEENKKLERANLDLGDTIGMYVEEFKKLKDYISELEAKVKDFEVANTKLLAQNRVRNCVMSLSSELNTKIDNQSKEITRLLKNQEKLKAQITNDAGIISQLSTNCTKLLEKIRELEKELDFWKTSDTFKAEELLSKIRDLIDGKE